MAQPIIKPLPFACSKKTLVEMYINQMPEREILREINEIIAANRGKECKSAMRIKHREFRLFVKKNDAPNGYEDLKDKKK